MPEEIIIHTAQKREKESTFEGKWKLLTTYNGGVCTVYCDDDGKYKIGDKRRDELIIYRYNGEIYPNYFYAIYGKDGQQFSIFNEGTEPDSPIINSRVYPNDNPDAIFPWMINERIKSNFTISSMSWGSGNSIYTKNFYLYVFARLDISAGAPDIQFTRQIVTPSLERIKEKGKERKADFSYVDLSNLDLRNLDLEGADFTGAILEGTNFSGTNLKGSIFNQARLAGAIFNSESNLQGVHFTSCDFEGCDLTNIVNYKNMVIEGDPELRTSFKNAKLNFDLLGLNWTFMDLTGATINNIPDNLTGLKANHSIFPEGIDLRKRNISDTDFGNAIMSYVILDCCFTINTEHEGRANFQNATMHKATMQYCDLEEANFENTKLQGANLSFGNFSASNFTSAVLEPLIDQSGNLLGFCSLNSSNLAGADFSSSYLSGTIFSSCILNGAKFNEATMDSVDFSHAFLLGVYITGLSGKMCKGVIFEGACLIGCFFNDTDFSPSGNSVSNFIDACLQGANFTGSTLTAADFTNAIIALEDGKEFPITYTKSNGSVRETTIDYDKTTIEKSQITGSSFCPDGSNGPCTTDKQLIANDPLEFFAYKDVPNSQKEANCSS